MTEQIMTLGIQIVPLRHTQSAYQTVERAINSIAKSNISYRVTPFETVMEGHYEQLMQIAQQAQQIALDADGEILVYYRLHLSKDRDITFAEKQLH